MQARGNKKAWNRCSPHLQVEGPEKAQAKKMKNQFHAYA